MEADKKIIAKIQKLLALSKSSNREEAESAALKVQELLVKYNLSLNQVNSVDLLMDEQEVVSMGRIPLWIRSLVIGIADAYMCTTLTSRRFDGHSIIIVGRKINVDTSIQMYEYLSIAIKRITKREINKDSISTGSLASYRNQYRLGLAMGISIRLKKLLKKGNNLSEEKALVVNLYKTTEKENNIFIHVNHGKLKTRSLSVETTNKQAFREGYIKSFDIGLDAQVETDERRNLSAS